MFTDEYFMREALKEARMALDLDEVPVGAVIVCQDGGITSPKGLPM
jgi:tRNA(adenine34) deaminase